jgi:RNA polymerase sigma factor (sigma-70 family)
MTSLRPASPGRRPSGHGSPHTPPEIIAAARTGDRDAEAAALEARLPGLRRMAERLLRPGIELEDLVQEGCLGWIRGARISPSTLDFTQRTTSRAWTAMSEAAQGRRLAIGNLGSIPSASRRGRPQVAIAPGPRVHARHDYSLCPYRSFREIGEMTGPAVYRIEEEVIDAVDRGIQRGRLLGALSDLDPQSQAVIRLRVGLYDGPPLTVTEVGRRTGVSRHEVCRLEHVAIVALRRALVPAPASPGARPGASPGASPGGRPGGGPRRPLGPSGDRLIEAIEEGHPGLAATFCAESQGPVLPAPFRQRRGWGLVPR